MLSSAEFRQIYTKQAVLLVRQFYYKCGDENLAQDLVHEAFLKLWQQRSKVTSETAGGFLYTTANHQFLDLKKRDKVKLRYQNQLPKNKLELDPSHQLEEKEFAERLEDYLNRLPDDVRVTFLLNRMDKLTYREIAERLGITQKAVEKRISKALIELRKLHPKI